METRNSWGIVYVAAIFAALAIGTALTISYFQNQAKQAQVVAITKSLSEWSSVSDVAPTSTPAALPAVSDAVSQDLVTGYAALVNKGNFTTKERDAMLADVVKKNVTSQNIVPVITLTDLNIGPTSVENYLALFAIILGKSTQVKHYELNVFVKTVSSENAKGTPELMNDAILYEKIAAAMLIMQVPPELASQHLEVAKSVGALAKAVANMSQWKGDPIDALTMVDSFNKSEAYVKNSVNNLLAAVTKLQKKKV